MAELRLIPPAEMAERMQKKKRPARVRQAPHWSGEQTRGQASFRPQARLIRLLGEELISDEATALIELVKNAYDADATRAVITVDPARDHMMILDDGIGMSIETILGVWLTPATRYKRGGSRKQRTQRGRFPLGEKGVGRFAVDKLGASLELITRRADADQEVVVRVNWGQFDEDAFLDEILTDWEVRAPTYFVEGAHGTLLRISRLRTMWDEALLQRVLTGLSRLISPNSQASDFAIILECPAYPALSGAVRNRLLEQAPYLLQGQVDEQGRLLLETGIAQGHVLDLRLHEPEVFRDEQGHLRVPRCGPFRLTLSAWDLDAIGQRQAGLTRNLRQVLKQWCGVSIYRDDFRVLPYGEKDDDWLELNQRRVNNPTLRLSNNQVVGFIDITQQYNAELRDRTSREGMIDTLAFDDFKQLVLAALAYLEEQRFQQRRQAQPPAPVVLAEVDPVLQLVRQLQTVGVAGAGQNLATQLERAYQERLADYQKREDNLLRLAGLGVAAERLTHEMAATVTSAQTTVQVLFNQLQVRTDVGELQTLAQRLERTLTRLEDQLDLLTPLRAAAPDGCEEVDLQSAVHDALQIFGHQFRAGRVSLQVETDGAPVVRATYGHLVQILLALFDNALYWLHQAPGDQAGLFQVHLWARRSRGGVIIADNGPGITPTQSRVIFEPFYTTRRERAGLGLFIARLLTERYKGSLKVLDEGQLLSGANFALEFPLANGGAGR